MTKKIFKVIGIVLASIILFVGAVFGIMALMGRFKTPEVYPNRLQFINNEQTVVYSENDRDKLYSFVLNGFSDNQEYEVNQKDCYIYFLNNVGADLITLCDRNGTPLVAENNRYYIECNEYVYYKIKDVSETDFSNSNYGQVILQARDSRSQVQSNNLTIWVDREVSTVALDYDSTPAYNGEQEITIGVDVKFDFNYTASPEHSLDPISRETGKIIELYYDDPNQADYVPINSDTYSNYSFISYDNDTQKFSFSTDTAGTYEFKIAVFATYQDRVNYLNSENSTTDSYFERVSRMVNTNLTVNVVNSDISSVGMNSTGIALNLYSDNNYITLSGQSGVEGANDNNLGLYMIKDGGSTTIRFNEVEFALDETDYPNNWSNSYITFLSADATKTITFNANSATISGFGAIDGSYGISFDLGRNVINLTGLNTIQLSYTLDNITVNNNTTLIDSISCTYEDSTINFECSVGAAFLQNGADGTTSIKLLKSGSYLEFYVYNTQSVQYINASSFDYTATAFGSGTTKSWNIIAKNMLDLSETESLVLGILVVNNNGGAYFASTGVTVNPVDLSFEFVEENQTHNLEVQYSKDENQTFTAVYPELELSEIVNITNGSYDACVFITPKVNIEAGQVYDIEVIEGMTFIDALDNEYVLVGYMQGDKFVNNVKVRKGARNSGTVIYMLQLQNKYNQTANQYIQEIIENENNNITLKYSIQMENQEGTTETKYVNVTMFNGELAATLEDNSATISSISIQNDNLIVTINDITYICSFVSLNSEGEDVYLGNRSQTQDKELVADVVNSYISDARKVTITVSYDLLTEEIDFNYNPGSIDGTPSPEGGDTYINIVDGNVFVVENTQNHTLTLTSDVPDMLQDIYYARGFDMENIHINMYNASNDLVSENSNALEITNIEFVGDSLVLSYNSTSALSNTDSYLRIVLGYNNKEILSDKIYIESTIATDIQFKYTDGTNTDVVYTVNLAQTPEDALTSNFYIKVELGYDINANGGAGGYTYKYYIVDSTNNVEKEVSTDLYTKIFNSFTNGVITEGFQVLPAINGIAKDITYSSNTPSVADFNTDNGLSLVINKIGTTVVAVNSDDITRYFRIVVDTEKASTGESKFSIDAGIGEASTQDINVSLSDYVSYMYNNNGSNELLATNHQNVTLEITQISFGGDRDLITEYTDTAINIVTNDTEEEKITVLTIESDETSWKFTRVNYLHAGLVIRFNINVKACETISFELTFTSSVEININSNWDNFYAGTTVLLYEQSETGESVNEPVFKIKNTISGAVISSQVYINGSSSPIQIDNAEYTFTDPGSYRFSFVYNNEELDSYTINVIPNVIATLKDNIYYGGNTYNYSDLVDLFSFKTGVIYGSESVGIYPKTEDFLEQFSSYSNVSLTSTGSNITVNSAASTFTVDWIENIGQTITENITLNYNYNVGDAVRNIELLNSDITLNNLYTISRETQGDDYPDYSDNIYNIMSNINYQSFIEIKDNPQFVLSSIQSNLSNLQFEVLSGNRFRLNTNLSNKFDNVVLTFTFVDESTDNVLIYTTSTSLSGDDSSYAICVIPLIPDEKDIPAYSGLNSDEAYDLLNDMFDLDGLLSELADRSNLISSMVVESVDDESLFANTSFIGSGYIGSQNYGADAIINEIEGNTKTVIITYKIAYSDGVEYTFTRELTITNRQYIEITTPFVDERLTGTTTSYVFVGDSIEMDANNLNGVSQGNNAYQVTINSYFEPVNMGQTMNFVYDEIQSVGRVAISNSKDNTRNLDADFNIELVAYQNKGNTINYYNSGKIVIDNENKTVTFNQDITFGNGGYGYFIFKITSESGSVGYYFVYLYNQMNTNYNNVDYTNTFTFNSTIDARTENTFIANNAFLGQSIDTNFFNEHFGASINYQNVDFYLLDAEMVEGDYYELIADNYARQHKIDDKQLPIINNYTKLTIGMVFDSSNTKFYVGTLIVYVLPAYIETYDDITPSISGLSTGEYTKTITTDIETYANPFTEVFNRENGVAGSPIGGNWSAEIVEQDDDYTYTSNTISSNNSTIIRLDGTTINFVSYINNEDLQFTVKYIYTIGDSDTRFVLLVHYTYEEIGVNNNAVQITVGTFVQNNDETAVNSYFDNRIDLSTIIGGYNKNLTVIYGGTEVATIDLSDGTVNNLVAQTDSGDIITFASGRGMTYEKEGNKSYFVFDQITAAYTEQFVIRLDNIVDENGTVYSKTITANVLSGLYYSQPQSGVGYSQDNPFDSTLVSENNAELYISDYGSSITINSSNNDLTGVTRYYVGGLNIYTNVASTLDITLSDANYLVNIDGGKKVNFVHTAEDKPLILYIKVKNGDGNIYQSSGEDLQLNFYIKVVRTYAGIAPVYYIKDATHENVVSGYSITDIYAALFTNSTDEIYDSTDTAKTTNLVNAKRIAIIDLDGNQYLGYTPSAIGFTDSDNPNYVRFTAGENMNLVGSALTFSTVSANTLSNLYLSNNAGVGNIIYVYQVMSSSEYRDGFDYQVDTHGSFDKDTKDYVALTINDNDERTPYVYGETSSIDGETMMLGNHVATLFDGNNNAFYITDFTLSMSGTEGNITDYTVERFGKGEIEAYPDDIIYVLNIQDRIRVTLRLGTGKRLYVGLERDSGALFERFSIIMRIYVDSGHVISKYDSDNSTFITRLFEVKFYNYQLESDYSTTYDSIYATEPINLNEKISIISNASSGTLGIENAELDTTASSYLLNGTRYYITDEINNLFEYSNTNNIIMTNAVGANASVSLTFRVVDDWGYYLGSIRYNFMLRPNFDFRVNSNSLTSGDNEFYSNYLMMTSNILASEPPADSDLDYSEDLNTINNSRDNTVQYDGTSYYIDLLLELYTADGTDRKITDVNNILITEVSSWGSDYVTIDDFVINIHKDFTGLLRLRLDINLGENGTYTVYWNINVLGFVTLTYKSVAGENAILVQDNGEAFASGSQVDIVSMSSKDETGVIMSDIVGQIREDSVNTANNINNTISTITLNISYVISNFTDTAFDADTTFNNGSSISVTPPALSNIFRDNSVPITLPSVPQSSGPNYVYYNVTYRFAFTYLDQTTIYYYVTYKVYNSATVTANSDALSVDVNNDIISEADSGTKLFVDMFYFVEQYSDENGNSFTLRLDSSKNVVMDVVLSGADNTTYGGTYTRSGSEYTSSNYKIQINQSGENYTFRILDNTGLAIEGKEYTTTRSVISNREYKTGDIITNRSIFSSSFSNIDNFKTFIDSVDSVRFNIVSGFTGTNETIYFALTYINGTDGIAGRFGIDLTTPRTSSDMTATDNIYDISTNQLFNNELIAGLDIMSSGNAVVHVDAFDSSLNAGFKLTTSNAITAKGQFRVRDMFLTTQCDSTTYLNYNVIGVGTTTTTVPTNWVSTSATVSAETVEAEDKIGTITVESTTYDLYEISYTGTGDRLYNLKASFYAIFVSSGKIVTVDYGTNIQSYFFQVNYTNGDSVLDLNGKFATYANADDGTFTKTAYGAEGTTGMLTNVAEQETKYSTVDGATSITVEQETLRQYKNNNPTSTAIRVNYSASYNGVGLTFRVNYQLPENPFVSVNRDGINNIQANLLDKDLYIYNPDDLDEFGNAKLTELVSTNVGLVSSIMENNSTYATIEVVDGNYTGKITLNASLINQYFTENPNATQLEILFTIITGEAGETQYNLQFAIIVKK